MVKIAIAGAGSALALEVIDKLVEGQQHEVLALVRKDPAQYPQQQGVTWARASFDDKAELVEYFKGVEVVLNFIVVNSDPENTVGKLLVDAAVEAGVKRFAPSEWAMGQKLVDIIDKVPWYKSKLAIQRYLAEINKDKKVIEYTLFQVGQFLEYIGYPHQPLKHVPIFSIGYLLEDEEPRIVSTRGREDEPLVFTSVGDIAGVVRRAVEYEGEWPVIGGVAGNKISPRQVQKIVERIRGKPVTLDLAEEADIEAGILKIDVPPLTHPSIPEDQREAFHAPGWTGILYAAAKGAWVVSDEWNKLLPDYKFLSVEECAQKLWGQK